MKISVLIIITTSSVIRKNRVISHISEHFPGTNKLKKITCNYFGIHNILESKILGCHVAKYLYETFLDIEVCLLPSQRMKVFLEKTVKLSI